MNPEIKKQAEDAIAQKKYSKNIDYFWSSNANPNECRMAKELGGFAGLAGWVIQQCQRKCGVQMQVSKNVSDDLLASDFASATDLQHVPWIAPCVEVFFEDPALPTIVVLKSTSELLDKIFPDIYLERGDAKEYISALMQDSGKGWDAHQLNLQVRPEMYSDFMQNGVIPPMREGLFSTKLHEYENAVMCYMMHLAMKVFVFSSIPIYKPTLLTRKQMHYGGKPDVKGRPNRPSFHIKYLPSIIHPKTSENKQTSESNKEFHGRRGHIRWYNDERFVNVKGKWGFVRPVADPKTGKYPESSIFKIRK